MNVHRQRQYCIIDLHVLICHVNSSTPKIYFSKHTQTVDVRTSAHITQKAHESIYGNDNIIVIITITMSSSMPQPCHAYYMCFFARRKHFSFSLSNSTKFVFVGVLDGSQNKEKLFRCPKYAVNVCSFCVCTEREGVVSSSFFRLLFRLNGSRFEFFFRRSCFCFNDPYK